MITDPLRSPYERHVVQMQARRARPVGASPTVDRSALGLCVTGGQLTDAVTVGRRMPSSLDMKTSGKVRWRTRSRLKTTSSWAAASCEVANFQRRLALTITTSAPRPSLCRHAPKQFSCPSKSGLFYGVDPGHGARFGKKRGRAGSPLAAWNWAWRDSRYVGSFRIRTSPNLQRNRHGGAGATALERDKCPASRAVRRSIRFRGQIVFFGTPPPRRLATMPGDRSKDFATGACVRFASAAPAVMPVFVFSVTLDGWLRATMRPMEDRVGIQHHCADLQHRQRNQARPVGGIDAWDRPIAGGMLSRCPGSTAGANRQHVVNVLLAFLGRRKVRPTQPQTDNGTLEADHEFGPECVRQLMESLTTAMRSSSPCPSAR